ncbi:hypothetical protein D3OALGA1CA_1656 [Olavius algarvensis associated proteobacterium Delta 3]|nr:hypothetical protein D3OALGA1CA_1656 [Olavius algarvensis associated proteobacterium Delta 3]
MLTILRCLAAAGMPSRRQECFPRHGIPVIDAHHGLFENRCGNHSRM